MSSCNFSWALGFGVSFFLAGVGLGLFAGNVFLAAGTVKVTL